MDIRKLSQDSPVCLFGLLRMAKEKKRLCLSDFALAGET